MAEATRRPGLPPLPLLKELQPIAVGARSIRRGCAAAWLLAVSVGSYLAGGLDVVSVVCCLYDGLITLPEESYWV